MTKVVRTVIVEPPLGRGWWHRVDCAVRSDGSSPAQVFLQQLKEGVWEGDPDSEQVPDDEQVHDYYKLLHKIRYVAEHGEPERAGDVNYLRDGIWEFKVAAKRVAFADTDGRGVFTPKGKVRSRAEAAHPDGMWWFPELEEDLRLLNAWPKLGQKALESDMTEAATIRREDVAHDVE